jgi:hypothetical protein
MVVYYSLETNIIRPRGEIANSIGLKPIASRLAGASPAEGTKKFPVDF